jgi:hypothetical protein
MPDLPDITNYIKILQSRIVGLRMIEKQIV